METVVRRKGKHPNTVIEAIADVRDRLDGAGMVIVYNSEPRRDQRQLMECLGLEVVVDRDRPAGVVHSSDMEIPAHKATETETCKQPGCPEEVRYTRGVGAGYCLAHGKPLFQEHGRRVGRLGTKGQPKPLREMPRGAPLNKQSVQLGILGTRVEAAARRKARAQRKVDEADAALTAALDQFTAQLRETIERAKALRRL